MTRGHDSGKHRRGMGRAGTPPGRRRAQHTDPDTDADTDVLPVVDAYPDSPAAGLAKFNLGSIPASVTPPRSWRRAAWFSVAASALVLVGLVFAAVSLVTGPRKPEVVDALPGLPTAPNMLTAPTEGTREPLPDEATTTTTTTTTATTPTPTTTRHRTAAPPRPEQPTQPPAPPSASAPPGGPAPTQPPPTRPTRTTVSTPMLLPPVTSPQVMGDRTEVYYLQVVQDPAAAFAMTTGPLRREGPDSIERRYADVRRVEVQSITIDASRGTTRSRLRVVRADGTAATVERELTFTYGSDPKISGDAATS